ncbi:MAG: glycosyltransferase family 39 protein [Polyangiaceae bacterium]
MAQAKSFFRDHQGGFAIAAVGLCVSLIYLLQTPFEVRNSDALTHLQYVRYLVDQRALPDASLCTECHHPPAYYLLEAVGWKLLDIFGCASTRGLQLISLGQWVFFLFFSVLTLKRLTQRRSEFLVLTALVVFWPYSIIQSARLNNDTLVDVSAAATVYFLLRWWDAPRARWLLAASAATALGLATKSSALILVGAVALTIVTRLFRGPHRGTLVLSAAPALVVLALTGGTWLGVRHQQGQEMTGTVLGNANKALKHRPASYYLRFDPQEMLHTPYAEITLLGTSEHSYWNQMLKSSQYGTMTQGKLPPGLEHPRRELVHLENGMVMGLFALLFLGVAASGFRRLHIGPTDHRGYRYFCVALVLTFVTSAMTFQLLAPRDYHVDFRFILPVVIPMSALYIWALRTHVMRYIAYVAAALYITVSAVSLCDLRPDPKVGHALPMILPFRH